MLHPFKIVLNLVFLSLTKDVLVISYSCINRYFDIRVTCVFVILAKYGSTLFCLQVAFLLLSLLFGTSSSCFFI